MPLPSLSANRSASTSSYSALRWRLTKSVTALFLLLGLYACSTPDAAPPYTPPAQRGAPLSLQAWPHNHYLALAWHDVEDDNPDQTFVSVSTTHLQQQFAWLRENHYQPVSVDQILTAAQGGPALPPRAVLLSFDDGYRSFYDRVYPLLRAYNWPAVLAPVGTWIDTPAGGTVDFGGLPVARERFLTWAHVTEMSRSGLVEIAAHTDNLHYGILANPQGNRQPAAAARRYDRDTGRYETDTHYRQRIQDDVQAISRKIKAATGKAPRVWVWPYGTTSGLAAQVIREQGYELLLTLDSGLASPAQLGHAPRLLIANDPNLPGFANAVVAQERPKVMRAVRVRLDDVADADATRADEKLGALVQQIADLQITTVILDASHLPRPADNALPEVYFPNRYLPMRADLFNRVAWQLRSRAFVEVYAWLPSSLGESAGFDPQNLPGLYEDLARHAIFAGIFISDEEAPVTETTGSDTPTRPMPDAAPATDDPTTTGNAALSPAQNSQLARIVQQVKALRGQETRVAYGMLLNAGDAVEGQRTHLNNALTHADQVLISAGKLAGTPAMDHLAALVRSTVAPERLVISLDPDNTLASQIRQLHARGLRSFAYTPDTLNLQTPELQALRPVLSNAWYPAK